MFGPEVRALVKRYLGADDRRAPRAPASRRQPGSLLDAIDLIVPHQANKTMVVRIARGRGASAPERLYFNIERGGQHVVGEHSDRDPRRRREGVIDRPMRVFAPGFGAGAVGGYAVLRVDPAVIA